MKVLMPAKWGKLSAREGPNALVGQAVGARQTHVEREFLLALPTEARQFSLARRARASLASPWR